MIQDIAVSLISGLLLALFFFFLKEKVFRMPKIDGHWEFETKTLVSSYNPFLEMRLTYSVLLWKEGSKVFGTAEKIYEISEAKVGSFIGKDRVNATINGNIQKNIFSKDTLTLHIDESGKGRNSSTIHILIVESSETMRGRFISTIANQTGIVGWKLKS